MNLRCGMEPMDMRVAARAHALLREDELRVHAVHFTPYTQASITSFRRLAPTRACIMSAITSGLTLTLGTSPQ